MLLIDIGTFKSRSILNRAQPYYLLTVMPRRIHFLLEEIQYTFGLNNSYFLLYCYLNKYLVNKTNDERTIRQTIRYKHMHNFEYIFYIHLVGDIILCFHSN